MVLDFNADEIFQIAEQIEQNGARFYRGAAKLDFDEGAKQKLLNLAEMEDAHEKTFAAMRKELSGQAVASTIFDPHGEVANYLKAMADSYVFQKSAALEDLLSGKSIEEVLKVAIGLEKDSIVFYLGIKESVPAKSGKDKIDNIIKEEMSHVTLLLNELKGLKT
ncbi:MAG TPA: ferritin family protein [Candidatus Heimdallarchaeota archaeon]|nr:ferritin family protein [Candidatus Heimdallarchaeota archaeon]